MSMPNVKSGSRSDCSVIGCVSRRLRRIVLKKMKLMLAAKNRLPKSMVKSPMSPNPLLVATSTNAPHATQLASTTFSSENRVAGAVGATEAECNAVQFGAR